jgi:hypothetical protein
VFPFPTHHFSIISWSSPVVKFAKSSFVTTYRKVPEVKFVDPEESNLTSFAGLVIFDRLFRNVRLEERLKGCFGKEKVVPMFGYHRLVLWLMIHLTLGYRQIKDVRYYEFDPMVLRSLGLKKMPNSTTFSRSLNAVDGSSVDNVSSLMTDMVTDRLVYENLARLTLDFDGSVISTSRHAEGSAV